MRLPLSATVSSPRPEVWDLRQSAAREFSILVQCTFIGDLFEGYVHNDDHGIFVNKDRIIVSCGLHFGKNQHPKKTIGDRCN